MFKSMFKSNNMKWTWITWFFVLECVFAVEPPSSFLKQPQPSNLHINSKNLNKARHKTFRTVNHPSSTTSPEVTNEIIEPSFPDVIYPTSILEAAQPFYYSQAASDGVLGAFSNDVKTSYKTLTSGKGKVDSLLTNGASLPKLLEKGSENFTTINNQIFDKINEEIDNNAFSSSIHSDIETNNNTDDRELPKNPIDFVKDLDILVRNNTTDTEQKGLYLNKETDDLLEEINNTNTINNVSAEIITNTDMIQNETFSTSKEYLGENTEATDTSTINQTIIMAPGYIITSETGNSYEEFVSDIMNIYTLIEETIRAISVVEFVVSKALDTLDIGNKQNITTAHDVIKSDFADSFTNFSTFSNDTVDNYYDNAVDNLVVSNLLETYQLPTEENGDDIFFNNDNYETFNNLTINNLFEISESVSEENGNDTVVYNNHDIIFDNFAINNTLESRQLFTKENCNDAGICVYNDNIIDNLTINNLIEASKSLTGENGDDTVLYDYDHNIFDNLTGENNNDTVIYDSYDNIVDNVTMINLLQNNELLTFENGIEPSTLTNTVQAERYTPEDFSFEQVTTTCFFSDDNFNDCTFDNTPDEDITNYNVIRERT